MLFALIPVAVTGILGFVLTEVSSRESQKARVTKGLRAFVGEMQ